MSDFALMIVAKNILRFKKKCKNIINVNYLQNQKNLKKIDLKPKLIESINLKSVF